MPLSILIILLGSIGDVARGLALVNDLKRAYPNVRISWVVEPKSAALVELHSGIDKIFIFRRQSGVLAFLELISELRKEKFDISLDLQRHLKSGLISFFSAARRRLGFHPKNCKEFNYLFNSEYIPYTPDNVSKLAHYQQFLSKLGAAISTKPDFGIKPIELTNATKERLHFTKPYVVLVLGSSWQTKNWPLQGYMDLIEKLLKDGHYAIVLVGDRSQVKLAEDLMSKLPQGDDVVNLAGQITLKELVTVLKNARLSIGPDSGPGHIAAAIGTPYIPLFGPTAPLRVAPFMSEALVVRSEIACSPCNRKKCPGLNTLCMRLITADAVLQKVRMADRL